MTALLAISAGILTAGLIGWWFGARHRIGGCHAAQGRARSEGWYEGCSKATADLEAEVARLKRELRSSAVQAAECFQRGAQLGYHLAQQDTARST
jgi:hypothetical protein